MKKTILSGKDGTSGNICQPFTQLSVSDAEEGSHSFQVKIAKNPISRDQFCRPNQILSRVSRTRTHEREMRPRTRNLDGFHTIIDLSSILPLPHLDDTLS